MNGLDLHKALTEIDDSFVNEADRILTNSPVCEQADRRQTTQGRRTRKRAFRLVLIAACMLVLLVGTVYAATKGRGAKPFLELIGTDGNEEEIGAGFVTVQDTKEFGSLKLTLEDIIGDKNTVYVEIRTDYELDAPDGWLGKEPPFPLHGKGNAVFPDGITRGYMNGSAPFCRDGRLWYLFVISYEDPDVDLSHLPMQLCIDGCIDGENTLGLTFEWTNDYEAKSEVISVNKEVDGILLTDILFSLTRMEVHFKTVSEYFKMNLLQTDENGIWKTLLLDYIRLDDGKILHYSRVNGMTVQSNGWASSSQEGTEGAFYYNLLSGFSEDGIFRLVPFERIQSICINGEEIRIR